MASESVQEVISKENIQQQWDQLQNKQSRFLPQLKSLTGKKSKTLVEFYGNHRKDDKLNRQLGKVISGYTNCAVKFMRQGNVSNTNSYETLIKFHLHNASSYAVNQAAYKQMIEFCFQEQEILLTETSRPNEQLNSSSLQVDLFFNFSEDEVASFLASVCSLIRIIDQKHEFSSLEFHPLDNFNGKVSLNFPLDRIELSKETITDLKMQQHDFLYIVNMKNGTAVRGFIIENNRQPRGAIALSVRLKNNLSLIDSNPKQIFVTPANHLEADRVAPQNISAIHKRRILVSAEMHERFHPFPAVELVNSLTGASYTVNQENIIIDKSLSNNKIKLSYLQRQLLDFETPPPQIPDYFLHAINEGTALTDEEKQELNACYGADNIYIQEDYLHGKRIKNLLTKTGLYTIKLYPFIQERKKESIVSFLKKPFVSLSEKLIGQTSIQLSAIRPYSTDESSNVIRLSDSSIKLLGIEETDNVIITYKGIRVKARVLCMDSIDLMKETNIITSNSQINLTVGIPVHIRHELGMTHIGKTCEIERDIGYLLKKNYNIQFLPLIAVLFTLFTINIKIEWRILLACILFPLGIYVTFSRLREKISNT